MVYERRFQSVERSRGRYVVALHWRSMRSALRPLCPAPHELLCEEGQNATRKKVANVPFICSVGRRGIADRGESLNQELDLMGAAARADDLSRLICGVREASPLRLARIQLAIFPSTTITTSIPVALDSRSVRRHSPRHQL